ncbi:dnaJ homolog subfamily C member 30, mitochondrial-like [Onthophagus taurus]|uniref:dnaJ homolog subfamily C member 30, mitochondrial-like n=1 Tax=Onthophagus taurus TaxID=166361 RepID=UPI0039BE3C34
MYTRYGPFNVFWGHARNFTTSAIKNATAVKSHYEVLGINPGATQAEVKSAYYNLSKMYHPDKNQGCEDAATKFRDITNAYEVLGNVQSRRLYDKGVRFERSRHSAHHPAQDDDPKTRFYRSRDHRHKPPTMGGTHRQTVYDFDEWSRAHYGATFARDLERKRRQQIVNEMNEQINNRKKIENVLFGMIIFMMIVMAITRESYDMNHLKPRGNSNPPIER